MARKSLPFGALASGPEGTRPGQLELHSKPISSLCFAPKVYRFASGAKDGTVIIWDLNSDGEGNPIGAAMITGKVSDVAWRPDGRALQLLARKAKLLPGGLGINLFLIRGLGNILMRKE